MRKRRWIIILLIFVLGAGLSACKDKTFFDVTFDFNYDDLSEVKTAGGNSFIEPPEHDRAGYKMLGWTRTKDGNDFVDFVATAITSELTVYAKWEAIEVKKYSVTYDIVGAEGEAPFQEAMPERGLFIIKAAPKRENYRFDGWSDGTEIYEAGDEYLVGTSDIILIAQWTRLYKISYDLDGLSADAPETNTVADGESLKIPDYPEAENIKIYGWSDGKAEYAPGDLYVASGDAELTLVWDQLYSVIYSLNGEAGTAPLQDSMLDGESFTIVEPPPVEGLSFINWHDGSAIYYPGDIYTINGRNVLLTASWEQVIYVTVMFEIDYNGNKVPEPQILPSGSLIAEPELPDIERDIVFEGWFTENAARPWSFTDDTADEDMTLYAKFSHMYLSFVPNSDNTSYFAGKKMGTVLPANIIIPSAYFGKSVTGIYDAPDSLSGAFSGVTEIISVSIPETMISIGDYAFYGCINLSEIKFEGDPALQRIGKYAFSGSVAGLTAKISGLVLPKNLMKIDDYAFSKCNMLKSVFVDVSLQSIGNGAFSESGVEFFLFAADCNIASLGDDVFGSCTYLKEITLPSSLKMLGENIFRWSGLEYCYFESVSGLTQIAKGMFRESMLKSISIPERVTSIAMNAFYGCSRLETVNIPASVETIGSAVNDQYASYSFYSCHALTSVAFASGSRLKNIYTHAFTNCTKLASIELPSGIKELPFKVFAGCSSLTSVNLPPGLDTIGEMAFSDCTMLKAIVVISERPPLLAASAFYGVTLDSIFVPETALSDYLAAPGWSAFAHIIKMTL